ncbi:MAG: hypothetical protein JO016_12065 [Actinobacteria bacterium]|nr:hypothetical protein [Actinomycetota bacterium]
MSKKPSYEFTFSIQRGWVRLPVRDNPGKFARDRKVEAWAAGQARSMLGDSAEPERLNERAQQLTRATYGARARDALHGLVFYTEPDAPGPLAFLDVLRLVPDQQVYPELTTGVLRELFAQPSAGTLGDIDEQQVDLPGGPALRVRRQRAEPSDPTGQSTVMEGVTYAIRPPGLDDAIVVTMTWAALQYGDRLAAMAEAIARSVRITLD